MSLRSFGLGIAACVFFADQAVKHILIDGLDLGSRGPVAFGPWLDIVLAWNPGISYSLFSAQGTAGWLALLGLSLVAVALLLVWLWRARTLASAIGLGALAGGALGNACDRAIYGKVADFIHLHLGTFSPFGVFNLADIAIFAGVALLLYDSLILTPSAK